MGAELVLSLRDRELSRTAITHTRLTVGRETNCDVVIDNAGVSRNHAIILYLDNAFRVRDNDSQNGITVNGKPVKDCELVYGDVIGIGKFELKLLETPDDFDRELEQGSAQKQVKAPRNVMGTMQMNAVAVAGLRDQIAAQKAAGKQQVNGAPTKHKGVKPGAAKAKAAKPAADKQAGDEPAAERPTAQKAAAPKPAAQKASVKERTPAPAPAAVAMRAPDVSDPPRPPTNAMMKPIAIGVAVAVVLAVAFLMFH
jgi:pSer/pThr/pTyr-binding forkhead associated (FHA) protein